MILFKRYAQLVLGVLLAVVGLSLATLSDADAHTPAISADCNGVVLKAVNYQPDDDNHWSVTIGGATQTGTFGANFDRTFPVPQDGATTDWSAMLEAEDGGFHLDKSGTVGPCGETPVKVELCHATGSAKNPFVKIEVSAAGAFNGHYGASHQDGRDIIPPFDYQGQTYSQNWPSGKAIYDRGCKKKTPPHDECPSVPGNQPTGTDCTPEPPDCDKLCPVKTQGHGKNITCNGVRTGTFHNVRIPRGDTCILLDSHVNGWVKSHGCRSAYLLDTEVVGTVRLKGCSGDIRIGNKNGCKYDPRIGGHLKLIGNHNVLVCQTTVCKTMTVARNDGKITIRDSGVQRRLTVRDNRRYSSDGNHAHANERWIRLINLEVGALTVKANAPRKVIRRGVKVD